MSTSVFLSSTARDLTKYREAADRAIEGLDGYRCVRMEDFGARDRRALDFCRQKVGECDLFIGILGHVYGSNPADNEKSYTELEYEAAIEYEKPCLMFIAESDSPAPRDQQSDADAQKRKRQEEFRRRVAEDRICAFFTSPDELSGSIRQAIHNWELGQKRVKDSEPNVGFLVPFTCDRSDQEAEFRRHFTAGLSKYPGSPQFYLNHGEERENHVSLVKRLCGTRIQKHAENKFGEQKGTVTVWDLEEWPEQEDLQSRQDRLLAALFEKVDPLSPVKENYIYSPTTFASHLSSSPHPVVVIQHEISGKAWDKTNVQLIQWYLKFWGEVKSAASIPECLVFLNVVYSSTEQHPLWHLGATLRRFLQKLKRYFIKRRIRRLCKQNELVLSQSTPPQTCPFIMLKELSCVKPDDVMRWFRRHNIGRDDGDREKRCREIFSANGKLSTCKNMRDVESALNSFVERIT